MKKLLPAILILMIYLPTFGQKGRFVEGEVMVLLENEFSIQELAVKLERKSGATIEFSDKLSQSLNLWLLKCANFDYSTPELVNEFYSIRGVQIAQLNHTNIERRNTPNDPDFDEQWSLYNDGSNGGSGQADIEALSAWDIATGGNTELGDTIVVAVIDGGMNIEHEDLKANIFTNHNEIPGNNQDDDNNGYIDDVHGWNVYNNSGQHYNDSHGSHVAGIIGASGDNGIGVTGINWNVKILPISGSSVLESTVVSAYGYVLDMRRKYNMTNGEEGAYIVATNSSFGVNMADPEDYPLWCAMYDSLGFAGVLSAGATANANVNVDEVGDMPTACVSNFLLSVTNTTSSDIRNSGAAYGSTTIDLGAPGTSIYSTLSTGYDDNSGTSMATPHVAGAIALMYNALCVDVLAAYQHNPGGLALYIKSRLMTQGVDELLSLNGFTVSGGRLNLRKAVESVTDSCVSINFNPTDASCGICNGELTATVIGAQEPIGYYWSTGATNTNTITGLCAGTYTLTVVDAMSDTIIESIGISDSTGPMVNISKTDVTCPWGSDGTVVLTGADDYVWPDASNAAVRNSLAPGTYFITATLDNDPCTTIVEVKITEPQPFSVSSSIILPSPLATGSNGSVVLSVMGGTPPYEYEWNTGDQEFEVYQLSKGTYTVTVTDKNGCAYAHTVFVDIPEGQKEIDSRSIQIFPNPSEDVITLSTPFNQGFEYAMIDLSGRVVAEKKIIVERVTLDISSLEAGIYFMRIGAGQERHIRKIEVIK